MVCNDINECDLGSATCPANSVCSNTKGGYTCACSAGYQNNGVSCIDVNECLVGPCLSYEICLNNVVSFCNKTSWLIDD